jgi:predicted ATPase/DNA polymerase III delta prime subunit
MGQKDVSKIGAVEPGSSIMPAPQTAALVHNGDYWTVAYGAVDFSLKNISGLSYIQTLLQNSGQEFHALDLLMGGTTGVSPGIANSVKEGLDDDHQLVRGRPGDTGPILDAQAKQEYGRRIRKLKEELDEARAAGNFERGTKLESELAFLTRELARAVGLAGRDRHSGSAAERARLNVTRAIRTAIQRIAEHNAALAELLGSCIRTGSFCCYVPNPRTPIAWRFNLEKAERWPMVAQATLGSLLSETGLNLTTTYRTTFVGREEERAALSRYFALAKNGEGQVVIIAGPPGIGKTRTAREAGDEARQQGFVALAGNCYDRNDAVPFSPFVELLEIPLAHASRPAAIRELLGEQASELTVLLPQLRRLLPDLPAPLQVSPEQSRRLLFNSISEVISRQAVLHPLLLLLEDLHWADEGTLSLLVHLARSIRRLPLVIIATHRDDKVDVKAPLLKALEELTRLGVVERIQLRGLPQDAVARIIAVLSNRRPSPALVDLIYSNTEGNPLFVEELVRHLEQNQWRGDLLELRERGEIDIPNSLRLVLARRLGLVSGETRKVLGMAAVIGRSFTFGLLETATHADPDWLVDAVDEAEKAGLVSSTLEYPEARFKFAHELIRRAVLDGVSVMRRQRLHLNIAEAIELLYSNSLEEHAEDLAHHFWRAGEAANSAKAIRYLQMAGEKAVQSSANVDAIGHFTKALQLLGRVSDPSTREQLELSMQVGLGGALMATKGYAAPEVESAFARARCLCQQMSQSPQLVPVLFGLFMFYIVRGQYKTAHELGEQLLALAEQEDIPPFLIDAHVLLGGALFYRGEFGQAQHHLEWALSLIDEYPSQKRSGVLYGQDRSVLALSWVALTLWCLGHPERALERSARAIGVATTIAHPFSQAFALTFSAVLHQLRGESSIVLLRAEEGLTISTEQQFPLFAACDRMLLGWALKQQGQIEQGIEQTLEGMQAFRETGANLTLPYYLAMLTEAYCDTGRLDKALRTISDAKDIMRNTGEGFYEAEIYRLNGELLCKSNRNSEAEEFFRRALETSRQQRAKSFELRTAMTMSELGRERAEKQRSTTALVEIYSWFQEGFKTPDLTKALQLLSASE